MENYEKDHDSMPDLPNSSIKKDAIFEVDLGHSDLRKLFFAIFKRVKGLEFRIIKKENSEDVVYWTKLFPGFSIEDSGHSFVDSDGGAMLNFDNFGYLKLLSEPGSGVTFND